MRGLIRLRPTDREWAAACFAMAVVISAAALACRDPLVGQQVAFLLALPPVAAVQFLRAGALASVGLICAGAAIVIAVVHAGTGSAGAVGPAALVTLVTAETGLLLVLRHRLDTAQTRTETALAKVEAMAVTDELTGLLNRRGMMQSFAALLAHACRAHEHVAVLVADVDDFAAINDVYGHEAGDELLQQVGEVLLEHTRQTDLVIRLGGEHVAVVAVLTEPEDLDILAERLRRCVQATTAPRRLTVSLGGTACPAHPQTEPIQLLYRMIDTADELLYAAKMAGGNQARTGPYTGLIVEDATVPQFVAGPSGDARR